MENVEKAPNSLNFYIIEKKSNFFCFSTRQNSFWPTLFHIIMYFNTVLFIWTINITFHYNTKTEFLFKYKLAIHSKLIYLVYSLRYSNGLSRKLLQILYYMEKIFLMICKLLFPFYFLFKYLSVRYSCFFLTFFKGKRGISIRRLNLAIFIVVEINHVTITVAVCWSSLQFL